MHGAQALYLLAAGAGFVFGYLTRTAISSTVSKFKVSAIIAQLENAVKAEATKDVETIRTEVQAIAADLKKSL